MNSIELRYKLIQDITTAPESTLKELENVLHLAEHQNTLTPEQKIVLDERLAYHDAHPAEGISLAQAQLQLSEKYGL